MREKLLWFTVILFGLMLMLMLTQAQTPSRTDTQAGRFQIVTSTSETYRDAFRIDTTTGKTWALVGTGRIGWVPMADYPEPK